eukprot:3800778-Prymnesium_polylepis.2
MKRRSVEPMSFGGVSRRRIAVTGHFFPPWLAGHFYSGFKDSAKVIQRAWKRYVREITRVPYHVYKQVTQQLKHLPGFTIDALRQPR